MKKDFVLLLFVLLSCSVYSQNLFKLVVNNNYKAVKKYKGDVNLKDDYKATPLMWAIYKSDLKMTKLLIRKKADIRLKGWIRFIDSLQMTEFMYGSCLVIAAGENKMDIVKYLIKKEDYPVNDKEINMYDNLENGWNALHWASAKGNNDVIKYLIKSGADVNSEAETDNYQTPLHFAIRFNKNEAAALLIDLGADINKKDSYDNSPLLYALHYKNKELVKYLIDKGARPGVEGININDLLKQYFGVGSYSEL